MDIGDAIVAYRVVGHLQSHVWHLPRTGAGRR